MYDAITAQIMSSGQPTASKPAWQNPLRIIS